MKTGNVFAAKEGSIGLLVVAHAVRLATLPLVVVADWLALPVLRIIDRSRSSWWVVEVHFHDWNAEFVRIAEASTRAEAQARLDAINSADLPLGA